MKAFTMVELFVVVVTIALLAAILLPMLASPKTKSARIKCFMNLKQVGLAFRISAGDGNKFPFGTPGSMAFNNTSNAWVHFQAMSNELVSARVLICPKDIQRLKNAANDFSNTATGLMSPNKQNLSVSYFVGLGADETRPQTILAGDRNVARAESAASYSSFAQGGAIQVTATSTWSTNMMHGPSGGNIALGDASVQQVDSKRLSDQLQAATNLYGITNNFLLFPQ